MGEFSGSMLYSLRRVTGIFGGPSSWSTIRLRVVGVRILWGIGGIGDRVLHTP